MPAAGSVDDRDPLPGPVERLRLGDRDEPEVAFGQPVSVEAQRLDRSSSLRRRAAENLGQALPKIILERQKADSLTARPRASIQPAKEWNAPSGFGSFGVNAWNAYALLVSNPALPAAVLSMNGIRAATAWSMFVHFSVRS